MLKIFAKLDLWHLFFYFHHQKGSRNKIYFLKIRLNAMESAICILLKILEAHPGVWEMGEQAEFYVWGTGVGISNFIQGNKDTAPLTNPGRVCWEMNGNKPWQIDKIRSSVVECLTPDSTLILPRAETSWASDVINKVKTPS